MITRQQALDVGVPKEWITQDFLERTDDVDILRTQLCEDCGAVIQVHPDARWRMKITAIRCQGCAEKLIAKGYSAFEAYCVD